MSRHFEEAQERRLTAYIAGELGISVDVLDEYPFDLDENASRDGVVYNWRVLWNDEVPPGVDAHGHEGNRWSDIDIRHEDDSEPDD